MGFYQGATRRAYIQFVNGGTLRLASDQHASRIDIGNGTNGLTFTDGTTWTVWHSGNDGSGTGLDADLLDGVQGASFLRSDTNDSFTGTLSGSGSINITGNVTANVFTGNGSGLTGISADNANTLDGLDSTQFLRSDTSDTMTGNLTINGSLAATQKSFLIDHPTKPGMKLRHGSLEGPENGVYVRGRLKGNGVIELPEYWTGLVDADTITVNLTAIGKHQKLYVADIKDNCVYVKNDGFFAGEINCFYTVYGERKDIDKMDVET
jgi:hypothetical protein